MVHYRHILTNLQFLYFKYLPISVSISSFVGLIDGYVSHLNYKEKNPNVITYIGTGLGGFAVGGLIGTIYPLYVPYFMYKYANNRLSISSNETDNKTI